MFERTRQGAVDVFQCDEPINVDALEEVASLVEASIREGPPRIVFDLQSVPLIDGAGLESLLDAQERCQERGGALKLAGPSPLCRDIIAATGLTRFFEIHDDISSAVRSFLA